MKHYIIYTNKQRPNNRHYWQNQNRFCTFHTTTREEAQRIIAEVNATGYKVTAVETGFGKALDYRNW